MCKLDAYEKEMPLSALCRSRVHKDSVVACIRIASGDEVVTEVQTFDTTTASIVRLSE